MAVNIKHDTIILEWEVVSILSSGRTFEVPLHRDFHSHTLSLLHARQVLCHQDTSSSLQHTHTLVHAHTYFTARRYCVNAEWSEDGRPCSPSARHSLGWPAMNKDLLCFSEPCRFNCEVCLTGRED